MREIRLTNTQTGKKETLETIEPGKLSLYSCGPTVYGLIHIGNLRSALVADLFYRYFKRVGYDVTYIRNYTDIDDKIIKKANEEGVTADEVTRRYIGEVERDYAVAGLEEPTYKPTATGHVQEIIELIEDIIQNNKGYVVDGEVFFDVSSFDDYGKLSRKALDDLLAGARVEVSEKKRSPADFTLWKPAKPGEPAWQSPWGDGRPGWHIECSAMARKWGGDQIDIHHGGTDLTFPHHENEIAQSEAATGKAPFVRYWLHHAFLTMSKEKMSKSLGNILSAREFLTHYGGEVARYMLLGVHYRAPIDYADETVDSAIQGLQRLYEAKQRAFRLKDGKRAGVMPDPMAETAWGSFVQKVQKAKAEIDEAYANDFNTAGALGELFTLIREYNRLLGLPKHETTPAAALASQELIRLIEDDIGSVIGVGRLLPEKALEDLERIRAQKLQDAGVNRPNAEEIEALIEERKAARASKDFQRSDEIRDQLAERGVLIKDSPQGTTWQYK